MSLRSCGLRPMGKIAHARRAHHIRPDDFAHPTAFFMSSNLEQLRVTRLDLLARLLHSGGVVLPHFYIVELARARLFLDQRVRGMLAGKIDQKLLGSKRMQPALEQPGGVWIGRRSEYGARAG